MPDRCAFLPKDVGFSFFGSVHLAWLAGILAFTAIVALWFSQRPAYRQRRISWAVAWLLCAMIVVEKVVLALTGHLNVYSLPFHLCELAPLLYLLFATGIGWDRSSTPSASPARLQRCSSPIGVPTHSGTS